MVKWDTLGMAVRINDKCAVMAETALGKMNHSITLFESNLMNNNNLLSPNRVLGTEALDITKVKSQEQAYSFLPCPTGCLSGYF